MSLEALYYLSQIVAAIAIVVSILFLAVEVRRNTDETRRQSMEDATAHRNEFVRMIGTDRELASLLGRGLAGARLPAAEWYQFSMFLYAIFVEFELNRRTFRPGKVEPDLWNAWIEAYRWWLQFPGVRKWWATRPAGFTDEFRAFMDAQIAQMGDADEKLMALFRSMAGEPTPPAAPPLARGAHLHDPI